MISRALLLVGVAIVLSLAAGQAQSGAATGQPPTGQQSRVGGASLADGQDAAAAPNVDVPILMVHYLVEAMPIADPASTWMNQYSITPGLFARQLDALAAYGYQPVALDDFMEYAAGRAVPPPRPVILTFDDGHLSAYTLARPILQARGVTATFFVTTGWLAETPAERKIAWPGGEIMAWPEVQALYADGFPVEAHGVTHARLTEVDEATARWELAAAREALQARLPGNQARFLAYPNGAYDPAVQSYVQDAGYTAALADGCANQIANPAISDIWALPRRNVNQSHAVDVDPAHPENFFMRRVDPDFPVPRITFDELRYLHADGQPGICFAPGENITVRVVATNHGDGVDAHLVLDLADSPDHRSPYHHAVVGASLPAGETRTFIATVPASPARTPGLHHIRLSFEDVHAVLGFARRGWEPAFWTSQPCPQLPHTRYLPLVQHERGHRATIAVTS